MTEKDNPRRSRRSSGAITLRDVAKLAGVAPITASRVMNTPDQVSPEVRQRVLDAVQRTGYVPNRMAGGLASARSRLIAAVVPSTVMSVFMETIEALNSTLFDAGYQLMLGQSGYSADREELLLEAIIGRRPDGIFLTGIMGAGKGRTRLVASGIPVVETWDLTPTPIDMLVGFSHLDIGRAVAQFFVAKGRKRLALVTAEDERAARRAACLHVGLQRCRDARPVVLNANGDRICTLFYAHRHTCVGPFAGVVQQVAQHFLQVLFVSLDVQGESWRIWQFKADVSIGMHPAHHFHQ